MVGISYDQKPYRRAMIETWGGDRPPQPLRPDRGRPLAGRRTSRAASGSRSPRRSRSPPSADDTNYSLGSVLNHVCLHQTVIGQECIEQMEMAGESPDVVIGCVGGGSNFAGLAFPFLRAAPPRGHETRFVGAEPAACPTLTRGALRATTSATPSG